MASGGPYVMTSGDRLSRMWSVGSSVSNELHLMDRLTEMGK